MEESETTSFTVPSEGMGESAILETRLMSFLTPGEAEKLCSVIQCCDSSFKTDSLGTETSSQPVKYLSCLNEELDSSDNHLPECIEREPLKENWSSYNRLVNKHRRRMKKLLPYLKGKSQDSLLEESPSDSEMKWLWEDAITEEVAFRKKLQEAELAIGSAEMFLPSFKETLSRITTACYISAADMIKISMQEDLLIKEIEALKNMKGLLQQLLRTSKEKEINTKLIEDLTQKLTESETEAVVLKNEVHQKERYILELSTQLQQEKANVLRASHKSETIQSVQRHLQCQIEKKETENYQLRKKLQTIEKKIAEWKLQVGEYKQQTLAEKERREERKNALKKAASVQKQRAELLEAAVENLTSKIREKEIQLSEALSASKIWKSHHETAVDEKTRLEVQVEMLKKQMTEHLMELKAMQDGGKKSKREILGKINSIISENETISLENAKLKASLAALEANVIAGEAELLDLHKEAKRQAKLVEQYKTEVGKLETEAEELETRYEKVIHESSKVTDGKVLEMDTAEAQLKELEHVRDLQKAAEEKLQKCQESLLSCQKSCVEKSKAIRELHAQVGSDDSFLKQHSLEEENYHIQLKYGEVQRKLEEIQLQNQGLEKQLENQEESLKKTELQFKQKLASCDALTRQLEVTLEDGRKKLAEEVENITSQERSLQLKVLDLEKELRQKKAEHKQLTRKINTNEKHHEVCLKELEHSLKKTENQNQSIQNYVQFLKTSYVTMFG
ncbi:protein BCAP isoform X2 [Hemicordylus capensis]|uniref:protein BCAP isoform X2 n=1 Tax=Hemicordylus capensis TaxID=884348 RepID=UPI002304287D|nr:protein BCAP isoform X2 [Hemicordylus capensis]